MPKWTNKLYSYSIDEAFNGTILRRKDQELEKVIEQEFATKQQLLNLQQKYYQQFKTVLPMQKIIKLQFADNAFNREILKKMRDKRKEMNTPRR